VPSILLLCCIEIDSDIHRVLQKGSSGVRNSSGGGRGGLVLVGTPVKTACTDGMVVLSTTKGLIMSEGKVVTCD
jgi:hypothetical protein